MIGNSAHPVAKAPVCFLQSNDISVDFAQYFKDAFGVAPPISADAFADIVSCDLNGRHGQSAGPK